MTEKLGRVSALLAPLLRVGLGGLFVIAGALKLLDPTAFATEVANYHLFVDAAPLIAATLPAIEIVSGATLLFGPPRWRYAAAINVALLTALFTVAVTQVVARGINVACGCFGGHSGPVTGWTVARDLALFVAAAVLTYVEGGMKRWVGSAPNPSSRPDR